MASLVVYAGPTPHVLALSLRFALVEDTGADGPHDDAEDEETNCEDGVICGYLFCLVMTLSSICDQDENTHEERNAGNDENGDLRPDWGVLGPRWEVVPGSEVLGCVEDGEGGGKHGQNDETAGEVDSTEKDLCNSNAGLDFLLVVSAHISNPIHWKDLPDLWPAPCRCGPPASQASALHGR